MWDVNSTLSWFSDVFKANFGQLLITMGAFGAAYLTFLATRGGNKLKARELDDNKLKGDREAKMQEQSRAYDLTLQESQLHIKREEEVYNRTERLLARLEKELEESTKAQRAEREAFRQEREEFKQEIIGFKAQIKKLERRVAQLVRAFRLTGQEPPPEDDE